MQQNAVILIGAAAFAGLAVLFSIVSVATPGWGLGSYSVFECSGDGVCKYYTAAGPLLIISILAITAALLIIAMFIRGIFQSDAYKLKAVALVLLFIGAIFIVSGYSSPQHGYETARYSYHLAVAAGIFAYISTIFFSYYAGHTSLLGSTP